MKIISYIELIFFITIFRNENVVCLEKQQQQKVTPR